jgi:adenine-specific DNA-methyltransferase
MAANRARQKKYGQFFTINRVLQKKVVQFIQNDPVVILEPCIGRGDLVACAKLAVPTTTTFIMYEIDDTLQLLPGLKKEDVIYADFLSAPADKGTYKTIIGNPPYVRTKKGNLYIDFTRKCFDLLDPKGGELIFIVPSDFFKLTSAAPLLTLMLANGAFSHIFHPHDEKMFEDASIDILVFRYVKTIAAAAALPKTVLYNDKPLHIQNSDGFVTFRVTTGHYQDTLVKDIFHVYVGMVTGKEDVFKNAELGDLLVLNGKDKTDKYIFAETFPTPSEAINAYLLQHKDSLLGRAIRTFNESNWFQWGAPRNLKAITENLGRECIYIYNVTRKHEVAFLGNVTHFGGSLIMLLPKNASCDLPKVVGYLNSSSFKDNFVCSGRFKIAHRQISHCLLPPGCF